ncbi:MAG: ribonuclease III [Spirochaetaceae bacterium]|nr:ribonuclease III [Spirochaetaceae bacterium]
MLSVFQRNAGIRFKDISLLDLAFHHRSFSNESQEARVNNERLEFLGDAVLGMVVASCLYKDMSGHSEGDLARVKSVVVSENTLSEIAITLGIDSCLVLGKGEELSGGRQKKAILADAIEAVIGAYYLDSGYRLVDRFVLKLITPEIVKVQENRHRRDYKTLLQEYYQKRHKSCPKYELVRKTGPDHDRTFWVEVKLGETRYGPASGKNKKQAEQSAAKLAWDSIADSVSEEEL